MKVMVRFFTVSLLLVLLCTALPVGVCAAVPDAATLSAKKTYLDTAVSTKELTYYLYVPADYAPERDYALLVYLHGDDGFKFDGDEAMLINTVTRTSAFASNTIVMIPVCEGGKWIDAAEENAGSYSFANTAQSETEALIESCIKNDITVNYHVNKSTVYLAGYGMGATAVFDLLCRNSGAYACGMMAAGLSDSAMAESVKNVPMWFFHAKNDEVTDVAGFNGLYDALMAAKAENVHMTAYDDGGHAIAGTAFSDADAVSWLLTYGRTDTVKDVALNDLNDDSEEAILSAEQTDASTSVTADAAKPADNQESFVLSNRSLAVIILSVAGVISLLLLIMGFSSAKNR